MLKSVRLWKPLAIILSMASPSAGFSEVESVGVDADLSETKSGEHVILLHGLARTPRCMNRMERRLAADGYTVHNIGYPSRKFMADTLVADYIAPAIEVAREAGAKRIHVVAHSLGAILIRLYARSNDVSDFARVVMLGPPNQGSEVVDKLGDLSVYNWVNGPVGEQLGTASGSLAKSLGPVNFETGVIAGNRSINPILSTFIPGDNDGKVSVVNTHVEGSRDHLVIPCAHPYLMSNLGAINQVRHFLEHGEFLQN